MTLFRYPDRLTDLAIEAFVPIGLNILKNLIKEYKDKGKLDPKLKNAEAICKNLKEMIDSTVPACLANEVTERILNHVVENYPQVVVRIKKQNHKKRQYCREVAFSILSAVIHRSATEMKFSDKGLAPYEKQYDDETHISILSIPPVNFSNLRVIKLGDYFFKDQGMCIHALEAMENLQEFSYPNTNKMILETLSVSCKQLVNLDVSKSKLVSSDSIQVITRFKWLNRLNVSHTNLDSRQLLQVFSQYEVSSEGECMENPSKVLMNTLECFVTCSLFPLLPVSFPNLKCLIMHLPVDNRGRKTDVSALKGMTKLSNLKIVGNQFDANEELTYDTDITYVPICHALGEKLMNLKLFGMESINLTTIDNSCPMLKELELCVIRTIEGVSEDSLPKFHNLHLLKLKLGERSTTAALSQITNFMEIVIYASCESSIKSLIQKTVKGEIKSLHINGKEVNVTGTNIIFKGYDKKSKRYISYSRDINKEEEFLNESFKFLRLRR